MNAVWFYRFPVGVLGIAAGEEGVTHVFCKAAPPRQAMEQRETPLIQFTAQQLAEYFAGERQGFDIPLAPQGTPFQQSVWQALCRIPYGQTRSYQQLAQQLGRPNACRAVGSANHRNPIMILIPCHRVIGKDGSLTGYAGGLEMKRRLLELERASPLP